MAIIDRKLNQSILLGQSVLLKVIEMASDHVVLQLTSTGKEDIFAEELLVKFHLKKITLAEFITEKTLSNKKITLKVNEALLMGKDGHIRVAKINNHEVTLRLDFPPEVEIIRPERLKNPVFNYRSTTACSF